jgi:hypothetical protein
MTIRKIILRDNNQQLMNTAARFDSSRRVISHAYVAYIHCRYTENSKTRDILKITNN